MYALTNKTLNDIINKRIKLKNTTKEQALKEIIKEEKEHLIYIPLIYGYLIETKKEIINICSIKLERINKRNNKND